MDRREFLKSAGVGGAALLGAHCARDGKPSQPGIQTVEGGIQKYNTLGRTGWKASDVSLGGGGLKDPAIVERAVALGINYFDTAPDYMPASEETLGKVLPKVRDKVFIATKMCTFGKYPQHLALHTPAAEYIRCLEASLKRLQTDRVDVLFVHAVGERPEKDGEKDVERLRDPEMLKATDTLKKQGKIRFLATSSHGPYMMADALTYAVECGHIDLIMPSWNFMFANKKPPKDERKPALNQKPEALEKVLAKAKEKNVAVVAMKTIPPVKRRVVTGTLAGLESKDPEVLNAAKLAALKWALSNPAVCCLVKGVKSLDDLELYVQASGQTLTQRDHELLHQYASAITQSYCRTGCGECVDACPKGVNIPEVMRYNMYFEDYGHERTAMEAYGRMAASCTASECQGCDAPCEAACPHGLPMRDILAQAHSNLHFA